ncbi:hypothetical protein D3C73_1589720 [compost metagenome]
MMVIWSESAEQQKQELIQAQSLDNRIVSELEQVLSLDPRPAYQNDAGRIYKMNFAHLDVSFSVGLDSITVVDLVPL